MVNTNKFHLLQLTPEPINSSTPSINNDETPEIPTTPLIPQQQQQQHEAYQIALRLKTYKNRNIIKLYKKYTEEKTTKTNALLKIYQYIQDINIRVDKNKNNKHNAKRSNKVNPPKST